MLAVGVHFPYSFLLNGRGDLTNMKNHFKEVSNLKKGGTNG